MPLPSRSLVGLIPAAGRATRLGLAGGSKVVQITGESGDSRPVAAATLDAMGGAGIDRAYVVLREGKWDIPRVLAAEASPDWPDLAYLVTEGTASLPASLNLAYHFVRGAQVVLGFGDVWFVPGGALADLLEAQRSSGHDITLALFPSDRPDKTDMVETADNIVTGFRIKPGSCELIHTWILATWGPRFTDYLHRFLEDDGERGRRRELQVSDVLAAALGASFTIGAHVVHDGRFIDIGTPEDLERATRHDKPGA